MAGDSEKTRKIPQEWKNFPNAIRRCAWEVAQIHANEPVCQRDLFVKLSGAMKSQAAVDGEAVGTDGNNTFMKALSRAHIVMTRCIEMTEKHGWIDVPLKGDEPYSDGTFPVVDEDESQSIEENMEDTVMKKEIKEEVEEEEEEVKEKGEGVNVDEQSHDLHSSLLKILGRPNMDPEQRLLASISREVAAQPEPKAKKVCRRNEKDEDLSTRDIDKYLDRAAAESIDGSNMTDIEKKQLKLAVRDMLIRGVSHQCAAVKYCISAQRIVAFSTKIKQNCKRFKLMEERGEFPSTASGSHPIPTLDATPEDKLTYVNHKLDEIVGASTLGRKAKEKLKRAVRLVVWDGLSIAASSSRIGLPASTMFPYVTKARSALSGLMQRDESGGKTAARERKAVSCVEESKESRSDDVGHDEILETIEEVLSTAQLPEERREKLTRVLMNVMTTGCAPLEACKKENITLISAASYLARARTKLENEMPATRISTLKSSARLIKDTMEKSKIPNEDALYERGTVVIDGQRLPASATEIRRQIKTGELSHVAAKPFVGTRVELRIKINKILTRFRYTDTSYRLAEATTSIIVDHATHGQVIEKWGVSNLSLFKVKDLLNFLIDMNDITLIENGEKRKIPPKSRKEPRTMYKVFPNEPRAKLKRRMKSEKSDDDSDEDSK